MTRYLPLALPLLCLLPAAGAQRPGGDDPLAVRYSHSAGNTLRLGGAPAGEVSVEAFSLAWRTSHPLSPATRLTGGLGWKHFAFDRPTPSIVPSTLQEIAAEFGLAHRFNDRWSLVATARPGLHGDLEDGASGAFQVPLLALATYAPGPDLAWSFGLRLDGFSERPVLPLAGAVWRFAPGWDLTLGLPRAGLGWQVQPGLRLALGATLQGGNYRVARDPRPAAAGRTLDGAKLDYHEIRVGLAAEWRLSPRFGAVLEAGIITDQKFDYFERGLTADGGRAAFFTAGLSGRF